jgi:hypothetical protein
VLAACGGNDKTGADAPPGIDAASIDASIDAPPIVAPPMITISGTATVRMGLNTALAPGVVVAAYRNGDDATPVKVADPTDASGNFTLVIPTGGVALEGYLKATKAGLKDTYLYAPAPIAADTVAPINMLDPDTYGLLVTLTIGAGNQMAGKGLIAMIVVDGTSATSMPVAGATVSITPSIAGVTSYHYDMGTLPSSTAMSTAADGMAYVLNAPSDGTVTVSAMKTGSTFKPHGLRAWPDQFTTTLVTP